MNSLPNSLSFIIKMIIRGDNYAEIDSHVWSHFLLSHILRLFEAIFIRIKRITFISFHFNSIHLIQIITNKKPLSGCYWIWIVNTTCIRWYETNIVNIVLTLNCHFIKQIHVLMESISSTNVKKRKNGRIARTKRLKRNVKPYRRTVSVT